MSEAVYQVQGRYGDEWVDVLIQWSCDDNHGDPLGSCLCTWPDPGGTTLEANDLRKLALLGAAVALAHHGDPALVSGRTFWDDVRQVMLPRDVPQWIRDEIMRLVPEEES